MRMLEWLCVLALAVVSWAQYNYNPVTIYARMPEMHARTMANMAPLWRQQHLVSVYRKAAPAAGGSSRSGSAPLAPMPPARDFSFPYQGRLIAVEEMVAALSDNANERRQLEREMGELIRTVAEDIRRDGTEYDISKAMMFFTATMFAILEPNREIEQEVMDRLLRQLRAEMIDPAALRNASAGQTQRQWELLLGSGGLMLMGFTKASQDGNRAVLDSLKNSAQLGLAQLYRVDGRKMWLDLRAERPLIMTGDPPAEIAAALQTNAAPAGWETPAAPSTAAPTARVTDASAPVVKLGHYHTISGVHPAELRLTPAGLSFDPLGHSCNQAQLAVRYTDVRVMEPAVNGVGELLLNLKIRDPKNAKKTLNFNFAVREAWNDSSSGAPVVVSPDGAMEQLRQLAARLRQLGAR
jgi:hypothetical protein